MNGAIQWQGLPLLADVLDVDDVDEWLTALVGIAEIPSGER